MYSKSICLGFVIIFTFNGCTHEEVPIKEKKVLVYTPMKLSDADKTIEKEDNTEKVKENEPKEALSDFQKHMLYKDYKIVK